MRLLSVFGTRPEAVKMAPLLLRLRAEPGVELLVCVTAQHRGLLDQVLSFFRIATDFDLDLMEPAQALNGLASRAVAALDRVIEKARPDRILVHGDTTTALAAALAAFHRRIPVAHVEAGLRTYSPANPWPEELNRRMVDLVADLHFAPTESARANLCAERLNGDAFVTGNSGVDALRLVVARLDRDRALRRQLDRELPRTRRGTKLVLVTAHRREGFGAPFGSVCAALTALAARGDVSIAFPVHPNPALRRPAESALGGVPNLHLLPPLDLPAFVRLLQRADLVITDSGGAQEEAVALSKPVLVIREETERVEAVAAGAAILAGTDREAIAGLAADLLDGRRRCCPAPDLFGDGRASERIADALLGRPVEEFSAELQPRRDRLRRIG